MMTYEEGYWGLVVERSSLKAKNKVLLAALETLLPYLEERSQPGERWATLCAREAIAKAKGDDHGLVQTEAEEQNICLCQNVYCTLKHAGRNTICVLDYGETWSGEGFTIEVSDKQYERICNGEKPRDVVPDYDEQGGA